ncbi:MAG: SirB2 family protein [Rehaibacterium terrae]|uniref:SirB2 family protein n=1 Tax=Rehaibacterium terrae TaxID=1341696 RepID=UPI00391A64B6
MIEYYLQIKHAHIGLVLLSGGLFALRGTAALAGMRWPLAAPVRYLSYTIDTALLTAALMLLVVLRLNPFATGWLVVKLLLLAAYIVLGVLALKRARTRAGRALCLAAALAAFGFMYSVARAHHPLGFLHGLLS